MFRMTKKNATWTRKNSPMTAETVTVGLTPVRIGNTIAKTSPKVIERIIEMYRSSITSRLASWPS